MILKLAATIYRYSIFSERFSFPFFFLVIESQIDRGRQNVARTSVRHAPPALVPCFCSYLILTSPVICNERDSLQMF